MKNYPRRSDQHRQTRFLTILVLSMLIHALILLLFGCYSFQQQPTPQTALPQEDPSPVQFEYEKEEAGDGFNLYARNNKLGSLDGTIDNTDSANVLENEMPSPEEPPAHDNQQDLFNQAPAPLPDESETPIPPDEPVQDQPDQDSSESTNHPDESVHKDNPLISTDSLLSIPPQIAHQATNNLLKKKSSALKHRARRRAIIKERIQKIKQVNQLEHEIQQAAHLFPPAQERKKPKSRILAATKGFVEAWRENGTDLIDHRGTGEYFSTERIMHLYYSSQIQQIVQKAFSQRHPTLINNQRPPHLNVYVSFAINSNGRITDLKLLSSSGDNEIDMNVVECIQRAGPFPPIPSCLNTDTFPIASRVNVHVIQST